MYGVGVQIENSAFVVQCADRAQAFTVGGIRPHITVAPADPLSLCL